MVATARSVPVPAWVTGVSAMPVGTSNGIVVESSPVMSSIEKRTDWPQASAGEADRSASNGVVFSFVPRTLMSS